MWISEIIYRAVIFFLIPIILLFASIFTFKLYKYAKKGRALLLYSYLPLILFSCVIYIFSSSKTILPLFPLRIACFGFTILHFFIFSYLIYYLFKKNFIYSPFRISIMLILLFVFQSFIGSVAASLIYFSCIE